MTAPKRFVGWLGATLALLALSFLSAHSSRQAIAAPATGDALATPELTTQQAREQLAARYAPIVYLKKQSRACDPDGEAFAPIAVEGVLGNGAVALRTDPADAGLTAPVASDLANKGKDYYLDFPGSPKKPGCRYEQDFQSWEASVPRVAYAHIVTEEGKRGVALQYWFYYYFNDWNNNHESDWEMIQLFFDAGTVEEAATMAPDHVGYSQHSGGEYAAWDSDKLQREGDRPVVYAAAGSHSNQYDDNNYLGRAEEGAGFGCDDATAPSTRVDLEARLVPDMVSGPDDPYAWITYEGRWGERLSGEFNGPTGPNTKTQWTKPVTWDETKLRRANVIVPTGKTAGISPAQAFCGTVAFVSQRILHFVQDYPYAFLAVVGAIILSFVITLRNTSFDKANDPLRRPRAFGQILRTAAGLYGRNALLLLGVGLVFIPAGMLAGALQSTLFRLSPLEALMDVARTPRLAEIIIGVVLTTSLLNIAYVIVIAGVVASIREIEHGRRVSSFGAYAIVWENARTLVRARLRAIGVVILLSISVVGIPWAIQRGVSWLFIEQAVLLDDAEAREATRTSEAAVRGDWWRTAIITGSLVGIGALASLVVVAPMLLLATNIPLEVINLIASVIYILMAPFVGLALTLLYFDAQARARRNVVT